MTSEQKEFEEFTTEQFKEMMYNNDLPDHSPLIKISARAVYKDAEIKTDFFEWCNEMFAKGFTEGLDYKPVNIKSTEGTLSQDFVLTLACAQKIFELSCLDRYKHEARNKMQVVK